MLDEYNGASASRQVKDSSEHTPLSGNWSIGGRHEVSALSPAGQRLPKQFNVGLADKMPVLIEKLKSEGKTDQEIKEALNSKKVRSVEKYGNKSKIGLLFEGQNEQILSNQKLLEQDHKLNALKVKYASDFNRAQMHQNELQKMRSQFKDIAQSCDGRQPPASPDSQQPSLAETVWSTTNRDFYNAKLPQD